MKISNNILTILLVIIGLLIGYNLYVQHQLEAERRKYFDEKINILKTENVNFAKDIIVVVDSLMQIKKNYTVIDKERVKRNESIKKINNADSLVLLFNDLWASRSKK